MMDFEQSQVWRRLNNNAGNYYCRVAEPEREEFRKFVKSLLNNGQITVQFEKSNGETRAMICTLSEEKGAKYTTNIGEQKTSKKTTPDKKESLVEDSPKPAMVNQEIQKVWDCELGAWRSFRWDRLLRIEFSLP